MPLSSTLLALELPSRACEHNNGRYGPCPICATVNDPFSCPGGANENPKPLNLIIAFQKHCAVSDMDRVRQSV